MTSRWLACVSALLIGSTSVAPVSAQVFEEAGGRAPGMGGAFVAVANDSSATWWNPAGLATGPFLDLVFAGAWADIGEAPSEHDEQSLGFSIATPALGFSYYRLRITDIGPVTPTASGDPGRKEEGAEETALSATVGQLGATLVQTLVSGVHAGATLKYVRVGGAAAAAGTGQAQGGFDFDVGVIAVRGPIRLGGVVRNVLEKEFQAVRLPRQVRAGFALDAGEVNGTPLIVAVDADIASYQTALGDRQVVAVGGEWWVLDRRLGGRVGARFNTVGNGEQAVTAGASAAFRRGIYVDGYLVHGGARDERGWGVAARVSF